MGVRISQLPAVPEMQNNDVFVMDGTSGTRKLSIQDSLVISGILPPESSQGVLGSLYVQYNADKTIANCVYTKTESGWIILPNTGNTT